MGARHHPILAILFAALVMGAPLAVAQQGDRGHDSGSPGDESGASGTTGDMNPPLGQRSSTDVEDPMSGTPGTMPDTAGGRTPSVGSLSPEQIRRVQQRLAESDHNPGPVDGIMGRRTREALRAFQRARGLEPTGEPDERTLAELGVE